jgi:catechol 2,3-dioxygenase-like lactoylglutathione lyase family enzyme
VAKFYRDILGIDLLGELNFGKGLLDELLLLPPETDGKLAFYKKQDSNALLMEFVQLSVKGKSLASVARPPNLGLFMISFKVDDLSALMATLRKEGIVVLSGPVELYIETHGKIRAITVEGPSGVLVECFEE